MKKRAHCERKIKRELPRYKELKRTSSKRNWERIFQYSTNKRGRRRSWVKHKRQMTSKSASMNSKSRKIQFLLCFACVRWGRGGGGEGVCNGETCLKHVFAVLYIKYHRPIIEFTHQQKVANPSQWIDVWQQQQQHHQQWTTYEPNTKFA